MPPRKRARRSSGVTAGPDPPGVARGEGTSTPTPTATPTPTQWASQRGGGGGTSPAQAAGARYRTRHRRALRGPDVAAREGGKSDLVPPSDDDEYDVWRDVRAVERAQRAEQAAAEARAELSQSTPRSHPRHRSSSPWAAREADPTSEGSPRAGPSTPSTFPLSPSPFHAARRFEPLFSPLGARSLSPSSASSSSPPAPGYGYAASPRRDKGKRRADPPSSPPPSTSPSTHAAPIAVPLGSPKPFTMPSPRPSRPHPNHLPSSPTLFPAEVLRVGPPPDPPPWAASASSNLPPASSPSASPINSASPPAAADGRADVPRTPDRTEEESQSPLLEESQRPPASHTTPMPPSSPWGMDLDVVLSQQATQDEESQLPPAPSPQHTSPAAAPAASLSPPPEPQQADAPSPGPSPTTQTPLPPSSTLPPASLPLPSQERSSTARFAPNSQLTMLPPSSPVLPRDVPATPARAVPQPLDGLAATPVAAPAGSMAPPQPPTSSPDAVGMFGAPPSARPNSSPQPPVPPSPGISADPALLQFRFMRTFRARTALQLQPYTRERQLYDNMLRRGGLAKGRRGVAPSAEVRANADVPATGEGEREGDSSASSDEDATPPDAIVIGGTQDARQPRPRQPQPLIDADYDEYFLRFGEVADEEDEVAARRLQDIARERLLKDKDARRAERAAEKTRRAFEALIKNANKHRQSKSPEKTRLREAAKPASRPTKTSANKDKSASGVAPAVSARPRQPSKKPSAVQAKGRPRVVTYSRRQPAPPRSDSDSPLSSAPPSPAASPRAAPIQLSSSPRDYALPTPSSPPRPFHPMSPPSYDPFPDFNFGGWDNDEPATPAAPVLPHSGGARSTTASRTKRRRVIESSSQSSDADGDASDAEQESSSLSPVQDKRRRIAGRMLPAVMLRRMEIEEQDRRRRNAEGRRPARASHSPVRPGHAVVRRRPGAAVDMGDLFASEGEDEGSQAAHGLHAVEAEEGESDASGASDGSLGRPVILSSDTSGSEAQEDNGRPGALARLQRGDFDALVHGRGRGGEHARKKQDGGRRRKRRPALGLAKRVRAPYPHDYDYDEDEHRVAPESRLYQTRLDFPADPAAHKKSHKRTTSGGRGHGVGHGAGHRRRRSRQKSTRPAIRLDDRVIFATADFAFDSDSDDIEVIGEAPAPTTPQAPVPRPLARVVSARGGRMHVGRSSSPAAHPAHAVRPAQGAAAAPAPAPARRQLDEGVGKARSWANFERFPVDFDITPLPTGVYCNIDELVRGAPLTEFLGALDGGAHREPKPCSPFGVDLHLGMDVEEALAVLPIIVDGVFGAVSDGSEPDLRALWFFRDYIGYLDPPDRARVFALLDTLSHRLDGLALSGNKSHRALVLQVLRIRYALLEAAAVTGPDAVGPAATSLVGLLLTYGFDRTVRSLRRILRGQASTPQVDDVSVALWVSVLHIFAAHDRNHPSSSGTAEDTFTRALSDALDKRYRGEIGPLAAERIWFLVFGLCALGQFGADGAVSPEYTPYPRWQLVKRALGLIRVAHSQEAEEAAHRDQLQGRDRYIKTMVARCLRLSSAWRWSFDASSFSVATRDLGLIFKERQHRNLPSEPAAEFPAFITQFDISLTASDDTRRASAFELWLRLACVAASDVIGAAEELSAAHRAERDVQRLIMSIFPLSAFPFSRAHPPSPRQLGALVNRYSTMVVACYFSPTLLPWLIANSLKWLKFDMADFESRQVCIRGLMYLAVACRHHSQPLDAVVARLADILGTLQAELETVSRPTIPPNAPTRVEIERTMVLVVSCFRQIIMHPGYAPRSEPVYPDPTLLHECWTSRIFQLDFVQDVKSGLEIVATIQAFLDARAAALPTRAKAARRERQTESLDDYPSLGFDFDDVDLAALGGDEAPEDPVERQDAAFANIILTIICPRIYRVLSSMLPPVGPAEGNGGNDDADAVSAETRSERLVFINKLTQCWSDCAAVVVVEHRLQDWSVYVGPFGQQSWSRLGNDRGRLQVGLQFMLNVARIDPGAFRTHEEEFLSLLFQTLVTDALTVEHKYAAAVFGLPGALDHALFEGVRGLGVTEKDLSRTGFMAKRVDILKHIFSNMPLLLASRFTPAEMKPQIFRYANALVGAMALYEAGIDARRVLHRQSYRVFCADVVRVITQEAGSVVNPANVPALKALAWA